MSDNRPFLDTNVVVYAFDRTDVRKSDIASRILQGTDWQISWQVIQEFSHVALHRFARPLQPSDLADYIDIVLWPNCTVLPSAALYRQAAVVHEKAQYRYYDSLIVAAAIASGAKRLLSEDLQNGRKFGSVTIENPFL
jgi:predicted nucleic acid-binding protein